jgi:hypothetical protein
VDDDTVPSSGRFNNRDDMLDFPRDSTVGAAPGQISLGDGTMRNRRRKVGAATKLRYDR